MSIFLRQISPEIQPARYNGRLHEETDCVFHNVRKDSDDICGKKVN